MRNSDLEPGIVSLRKHPSTSALPVMLQVLKALRFYAVGKKLKVFVFIFKVPMNVEFNCINDNNNDNNNSFHEADNTAI